jgi:hypothetical protein
MSNLSAIARAPRISADTRPMDLSGLNLPESIRAEIARDPAFFAEFPKHIIGKLDGNAKTVKGNKKGIATAILYLTPASASGMNLCAMATIAQCIAPCLYTAGKGGMPFVHKARLRKTLAYMSDRARFMSQLNLDIARLARKAEKEGYDLVVRLNGTSDIRWENVPVDGFANIFDAHPEIQFYDYTKIANRKNIPSNYDLTFSYSGVKAYAPYVQVAINAGMRLAVVFRNRAIVETMLANGDKFMGLPMVDGDDSDIRHLDPKGSVVALYAKAKAKKDQSGFVVG